MANIIEVDLDTTIIVNVGESKTDFLETLAEKREYKSTVIKKTIVEKIEQIVSQEDYPSESEKLRNQGFHFEVEKLEDGNLKIIIPESFTESDIPNPQSKKSFGLSLFFSHQKPLLEEIVDYKLKAVVDQKTTEIQSIKDSAINDAMKIFEGKKAK